MSKNEHPNAYFFSGNKIYENKKFDRANNVNSKRRAKRIEEETKLQEIYLKGKNISETEHKLTQQDKRLTD